MSDVPAEPREVWPVDLSALIEYLRQSDFRLGSTDALRAVALLVRLEALGKSPRTPDEAARWLAPLLCTSARQQDILADKVRAFSTATTALRPVFVRKSQGAPLPNPTGWLWGMLALALAAVALVVLAFFLWPYLTVAGPATQIPQSAPWRLPTQTPKILRFVPLSCLPMLVWLLVARVRDSGKPVLSRRPYEGYGQAALQPQKRSGGPFVAGDLSRAIQGMRAHRRIASLRPDPKASARATAAKCGRLVLINSWRPRLPDYPVIIEAVSARDHLVAIGQALAARLTEERVPHGIYLFGADPQTLRTNANSPVTLSDLAARYGNDVLIILSDGGPFVDTGSGQPHSLLTELEAWRLVVLLTPLPRRRWSWRERRLAEAGFLVLPATSDGLRMLGTFLRTEGRMPAPALERPPTRPGPFVIEGRDALRWHTDRAPSDSDREIVLDAIALELPATAFELVCVLALFPELRPDLTFFAANRLRGAQDGPLVEDAGLAAIAALPWFRAGRIPDWLRLDLARSVRSDRAEEARGMFAEWLRPSRESAASDARIEITASSLGRVVSEHAKQNPSSPMRDAIFLRFCNREDISELDLEIPGDVAKAVEPKSPWTVSTSQGVALGASAVLLGIFIVFALPLAGALDTMTRDIFNRMPGQFILGSTEGSLPAGLTVCAAFGSVAGLFQYFAKPASSSRLYGFLPSTSLLLGSLLASLQTLSVDDFTYMALMFVPSVAMAVLSARNVEDTPVSIKPPVNGTIGYLGPIIIALGVLASSRLAPLETPYNRWTVIAILAANAAGIAMLYSNLARMSFGSTLSYSASGLLRCPRSHVSGGPIVTS